MKTPKSNPFSNIADFPAVRESSAFLLVANKKNNNNKQQKNR